MPVHEPLVYRLDGQGESFVRDAWTARQSPYEDIGRVAAARLDAFQRQLAAGRAGELTRMVELANAGNTTDQGDIIPPGYRPDLYVGRVPSPRTLWAACSPGPLVNATPFGIPAWVGSSGLHGANSEGTGPSGGTITDHTTRTVTPSPRSGEFVVTRELADSSNPAIDAIALNAMAAEYSEDVESLIATALAAVTDDNIAGRSTEGCYVAAVTGTGNDLGAGVSSVAGTFISHRRAPATGWFSGPAGTAALAAAVDDVGEPVLPFLNDGAALSVNGLRVATAWAATDGTDDVIGWGPGDVLGWESRDLFLRFDEKGGPENISLHLWKYVAVAVVRPTGIHSIAYTAA